MSLSAFCLLLAAAAAPGVQLSTLDGSRHEGELQSISRENIVLMANGAEVAVPLDQVMDLRPEKTPAPEPAADDAKAIRVQLLDGTMLDGTDVETTRSRSLDVETAGLGRLSTRLASVGSIRFGKADEAVRESWGQLTARELKRDLLVIRKDDVLDFLDGIVASVGQKEVGFLLDGNEIPVPRAKVYGIVFARRPAEAQVPVCELHMPGGQLLRVATLGWQDGLLQAELLAGGTLKIPFSQVNLLDFSLGKVRYFSAMEPRSVEYSDWYADVLYPQWQKFSKETSGVEHPDLPASERNVDSENWQFRYRRDVQFDGKPLNVARVPYAHGLCIHSRTRLTYRIGGEYRRFRATMGIDYERARRGLGHVHVVIRGDGQILLETDVAASDEARKLDLDVEGVRDLEILVDFGDFGPFGDSLDLAEARVIR